MLIPCDFQNYSSPSNKMQSQCTCINFGDEFIPTHPSVCWDHIVYTTADWYMTRRRLMIRQSSYKVTSTAHSIGDRRLIIYNHKLRERKVKTLYQELKRSQTDRHTQTHGNCIEIFPLAWPSFSIERE